MTIQVYCGGRRIGRLSIAPKGWPELPSYVWIVKQVRPLDGGGAAPAEGRRAPRRVTPRSFSASRVRLPDGAFALDVADETTLLHVDGFELTAR